MYRRSENSESSASSRTAITGQSGKLSREGIIPEANSIRRNHTSKDVKNFRTLEFKPQTRVGNRPSARPAVQNGGSYKRGGETRRQNPNLHDTTRINRVNSQKTARFERTAGRGGGPADRKFNNVQNAGISNKYQNRPQRPANRRRRPNRFTYALCKTLLFLYEGFMKWRGSIAVASCVLAGSVILVAGVYASSELSGGDISANADFSIVERSFQSKDILKTSDVPVDIASTLLLSEKIDALESSAITGAAVEMENMENDAQVEKSEDEAAALQDSVTEEYTVELNFYDREDVEYTTCKTTVGEFLNANGCVLNDSDILRADLNDVIDSDRVIDIDSVEYKSVSQTETVPFETETIEVQTIPRGTYKAVSDGQDGEKETIYSIEYVNGVETSREVQSEYITKYPVNAVTQYGTGGVIYSSDGSAYSYSYLIPVRATYYNLPGNTASGTPVGNNVIATDPSVIPLGTSVYLKNDYFDMGTKTAADTGGGVVGNTVDIWMNESSPYFGAFAGQGVWDMTAYILD